MTIRTEPITFRYTFKELDIHPVTVAGMMGYTDPDSILEPVIDSILEVMRKAEDSSDIKGGYIVTDDLIIDSKNKRIFSHDHWFETKQIVTHQLRRSEKAAWFICTAGEALSSYSREQTNAGDLVKGYTADVLANIIVEKALDFIQATLKDEVAKNGLKITNRYSPGYCDWDITEQKKLFQIFPEKYLDISLTESCLMIPIKSVSGVVGIGKEVHYNEYICNLCKDRSCTYRKSAK